jgi:hypothetical protein
MAQKPLLVRMLSTSFVVLSVHAWCGADGVALVEAKMDEGEQEGVVGDVGSAVLEILVGWDGQRCSAVSAPSKR